jgi:cation:H+ antiporter
MALWIPLLQLTISLVVLWKICDIMVEGLSNLAHRFKIPVSFAGAILGIVSYSTPEFGTSLFAILVTNGGHFPDISLATILGCVLFSLTVILGICLSFRNQPILPACQRDGLFLAAVLLLMLLSLHDGRIGLWESLAALVLYGMYGVRLILNIPPSDSLHVSHPLPTWLAFLYFFGAIAIIGVAYHFAVEATIQLTYVTQLPITLLSVFVLAIGISIPELFTVIASVRRGHGSLAISNLVASNIFNILVCLGFPLVIFNSQGHIYHLAVREDSVPLDKFILVFSLLYLFCTFLLTLLLMRLRRIKGWMLIGLYLAYCLVILAACLRQDSTWIEDFPKWFGF